MVSEREGLDLESKWRPRKHPGEKIEPEETEELELEAEYAPSWRLDWLFPGLSLFLWPVRALFHLCYLDLYPE